MNVKSMAKGIYWRAIQSRLFNRIRPRISHTRSFLLEGKPKGGSNLSILIFADHQNVVLYMSNLVYAAEPQTTTLGRINYHNIPSVVEKAEADIVFAELPGVLAEFFSRTFLILPRVNFALDISPSWETVVARMRRLRRRTIHKVEKLPYTYEVTNDPEKFSFFYNKMYLPFVSKTPEDSARLTPQGLAKEWFSNGELTFAKSNGTYLAGILHHPDNGSTHCRLVAFEEGMALQAAFFSLIKKAKQEGHKKINYGETPPFIRDGLFLYKRSWGMKMKPKMDTAYAIKFCNFGEAVQDFLMANPFIFTDFKKLIGFALSSSDTLDFNSLKRKYYTPGLSKLVTFHPEKNQTAPQVLGIEGLSRCTAGAMNPLIEMASEKGFFPCLSDFSK